MIKHIIFDLDGVLVDAVEIHAKAFIQAVFDIKQISISPIWHSNYLNGLPTHKKLENLGITNTIEKQQIHNLKQEYTFNELNNLIEDKELQNILIELRRQKLILSCASNSIQKTVDTILSKLGIIHYFDSIMSNQTVDNSKPSPEMYYKCMIENQLWVPDTLIIEDSEIGQTAIRNSGCKGLIIKNRQDLTLDKIIRVIEG